MTLDLSLTLAARQLELHLNLGPTETLAIMGPNGAGKSTILQILAGLVKPDAGHATLGDRLLFRVGHHGTWLPPHERGIGLLAQQPLLFPHLTVIDNVAFGPRSTGASKAAASASAHEWLREVDAEDFAARKPAELSGGQAQRVALARALATDPELLLLDEPMAALDVNSAPFLRSLLKRVLATRRAIIVTHDILDALMLADRVIVIEDGRIVEDGPTATVLTHPRSAFAASLAGLNILNGTLTADSVITSDGVTVTGRPAGDWGPAQGEMAGLAAFPPSSVSVFLTQPQGSPRNVFPVRVEALEPQGGHIRVRAGLLAADVSPAAIAELEIVPGSEVFFVVKAAEVLLYPAG